MTFVYVILFAVVLLVLIQAIRRGRRRSGTWSDNGYTSTDTSPRSEGSSYEPATRGGSIGPAVAAGAIAGGAIGAALGTDIRRGDADSSGGPDGGGSSFDSGSGSDSSSTSSSDSSSSSTD
ncbi:hypothetical protein [Vineibacter terrae]|uniref:hypothetical protein n=1 Tax=Vineibacter terrae TaxID=2586908 RepID=UPI002E317EC5|nr:hypothetical protein [Vineibacter terrae]HEX2884877.1 hypothetical protein [Vineibacter terrae]